MMGSQALGTWLNGESAERLNELLAVHVSVGGTARGRRYATEELNAVIVSQVAAHFQRFCRNLHSEAAETLVASAPTAYQPMLRLWYGDRWLDRRNAQPDVLSRDFGRFDFDIWEAAQAHHQHTARREHRLKQLNTWRNAVAHQDFDFSPQQHQLLLGTKLTLAWARRWRKACDGLARSFDVVVGNQIAFVTGAQPW
jgi:hypothetical protein